MSLHDLDLLLAYLRARDEIEDQRKSGRSFVCNPFERELVETDLDGWLDGVRELLRDGGYTPGPIELCGAPKGRDLIRPAVRMSLVDRLVYTAAVGACIPHIQEATDWSQMKTDFAPLFHKTHALKRDWVLNPYTGWSGWTEESLKRLRRKRTGVDPVIVLSPSSF